MKTGTLLTFFLGFTTACAALYAAGAIRPVLTFAFGAAASLIASIAFLMASKRARVAVGKILAGRSTAVSHMPRVKQPIENKKSDQVRKPAATTVSHPDQAELVSALVNLGARKLRAVAAVQEAIKNRPNANFDDRFRYAVNCVKVAA